MSKALKIIDGIIIALFIAMGAALLIPQFFGIETVTVTQNMAGNVDVGSTIYARRQDSSTIQVGDRILDLESDSANIYTITAYDQDTRTVEVTGAVQDSYTVSDRYFHVLTVIPLIGYLMIATQSTEGLIILVLLLAFVIVLFVASEMMDRNSEAEEASDSDDEDDDEDDEFYAKLAEKRRKERAERDKAFAQQTADVKKTNGKKAKADTAGMTELSHGTNERTQEEDKTEEDLGTDSLPDVQAALEAALENQPLNRPEETQAQPQVQLNNTSTEENTDGELEKVDDDAPIANENGEIELAMPVRTADELLQKAYAKGLDPNVTEDPATGVTLVDYSDSL